MTLSTELDFSHLDKLKNLQSLIFRYRKLQRNVLALEAQRLSLEKLENEIIILLSQEESTDLINQLITNLDSALGAPA